MAAKNLIAGAAEAAGRRLTDPLTREKTACMDRRNMACLSHPLDDRRDPDQRTDDCTGRVSRGGRPMGRRRQRRFSVTNLTITIDGRTYRVFNINTHGVGFLVDAPRLLEVGRPIQPVVINGPVPVRVTGIPRHVSQFQPSGQRLGFKRGWICGMEFGARRDLQGAPLFREYIAAIIAEEDT